MTYQQGYPQQQPSGAYQAGYPAEPSRGGNPGLAIIAGVLGLAAGAALVVLNLDFFNSLRDNLGFGDLPGEMKTIVILRFAGAAVLLVGLILVLVRKLAGAFVLVLGALVAIAAILMFPVLLKDFFPGLTFGDYFKEIFKFDGPQTTWAAVALIAAPLALIAAILPPTLNYLRGSGGRDDDFPQYPQQTYPQQGHQEQGYPQQGYPQQQQGHPQQQGYPQQQEYPQQPNNW